MNRACWNITNKCNEQCAFCFRDLSRNELSLENNLVIANKLIDSGFEHIAFSGGEALLYAGIDELLSTFYSAGVSTTLITNALLLSDKRLIQLAKYLDWLALPLDSINYIPGMRNELHCQNIDRILRTISHDMGLKVKINTVVSAKNYKSLNNIFFDYIMKYEIIERWNLFEFSPLRGNALTNYGDFSINEQINREVQAWLESLSVPRSTLSIKYKHTHTLESSYFVIAPNGDVMNSGMQKLAVGNLLHDSMNDILQNLHWNSEVYYRRTSNAPKSII